MTKIKTQREDMLICFFGIKEKTQTLYDSVFNIFDIDKNDIEMVESALEILSKYDDVNFSVSKIKNCYNELLNLKLCTHQ